ncbi:GNAT family N-acetyltransferase [Streptomyces sp. TR06-5]|uniref:GNAT family N-acetyltransferase n=1 Tax=unclassified Streptomyces TaxID=2593676 RepID=UPI0039A387DB
MTYAEAPCPTLRTERLLLEPYAPADEEDFVALFQDPRVSRWMGDGPQSEEDDRALFGRIFSAVYPARRFAVWVVRHRGRPVGHAEVKRTDAADGHEIVYALRPDCWGRGMGTELAGELVAYGFGALGLPALHATVAAENAASLALLERLGFRHVRDIPEEQGGVTRHLRCDARPGTR